MLSLIDDRNSSRRWLELGGSVPRLWSMLHGFRRLAPLLLGERGCLGPNSASLRRRSARPNAMPRQSLQRPDRRGRDFDVPAPSMPYGQKSAGLVRQMTVIALSGADFVRSVIYRHRSAFRSTALPKRRLRPDGLLRVGTSDRRSQYRYPCLRGPSQPKWHPFPFETNRAFEPGLDAP